MLLSVHCVVFSIIFLVSVAGTGIITVKTQRQDAEAELVK